MVVVVSVVAAVVIVVVISVAVVMGVVVVIEMVLVVVLLVVVIRALMWAGVVIDTFVEVLTVDMPVDVLIVVSNVGVGLLMDGLTDVILGVLTKIDVDVLVVANVNVFVGVMIVFEFVMPGPLE